MIPRDFGKKLSEIQNVGVTITPGSPRGWTTRAEECYYNAASEQKCTGIKRLSPARRQNIGWSSSPKQKENQRPTHWSDRASRPQSAGSDRPLLGLCICPSFWKLPLLLLLIKHLVIRVVKRTPRKRKVTWWRQTYNARRSIFQGCARDRRESRETKAFNGATVAKTKTCSLETEVSRPIGHTPSIFTPSLYTHCCPGDYWATNTTALQRQVQSGCVHNARKVQRARKTLKWNLYEIIYTRRLVFWCIWRSFLVVFGLSWFYAQMCARVCVCAFDVHASPLSLILTPLLVRYTCTNVAWRISHTVHRCPSPPILFRHCPVCRCPPLWWDLVRRCPVLRFPPSLLIDWLWHGVRHARVNTAAQFDSQNHERKTRYVKTYQIVDSSSTVHAAHSTIKSTQAHLMGWASTDRIISFISAADWCVVSTVPFSSCCTPPTLFH